VVVGGFFEGLLMSKRLGEVLLMGLSVLGGLNRVVGASGY
jgi:hypothetical protein